MPTYRTVIVEPQERRYRDKRTRELHVEMTPMRIFFICQNCAHGSTSEQPKCGCECHSPETTSTYECGQCGTEFDTISDLEIHANEPCPYPHNSANEPQCPEPGIKCVCWDIEQMDARTFRTNWLGNPEA